MANEKRLIDSNALMDEFRNYMVERYDKEKCVSEENCKTCEKSCLWRKMVMSAPTVNAVEVVRCKECKYRDSGYCAFDGNDFYSSDDSFCSYGVRGDTDGDG